MKSLSQYIIETTGTDFADIFVVYNQELLVLRRANYLKFNRGKWTLPGGHVENGEQPIIAIKRELKEETNIDLDNRMLPTEIYKYESGKTTTLFTYTLDASKPKPEVKISSEHAQYKWVTKNDFDKIKSKFPNETAELIEKFFNK